MKKVSLFATMVLVLAMCASAQQQLIDFKGLPDTGTPHKVPFGYKGLNWTEIYYVDALTYDKANGSDNSGPGFYTGPAALLAFGGGPMCFPKYAAQKPNDGVPTKNICKATISSGVGPMAYKYFKVDSLIMSAGWISGEVTFQAYKDGVQVGTDWQQSLTTNAETMSTLNGKLPNWGNISELRITPGPGDSFVLFVLEVEYVK